MRSVESSGERNDRLKQVWLVVNYFFPQTFLQKKEVWIWMTVQKCWQHKNYIHFRAKGEGELDHCCKILLVSNFFINCLFLLRSDTWSKENSRNNNFWQMGGQWASSRNRSGTQLLHPTKCLPKSQRLPLTLTPCERGPYWQRVLKVWWKNKSRNRSTHTSELPS